MKSIINEAATLERFGYTSSGLARTTRKKVIVTCEGCGLDREVGFVAYDRPCYPCGIHNPENKRKKRIEESGRKYGRLTIARYVGSKRRQQIYECLCDCGNIMQAQMGAIKSGNTLSCGCIRSEKSRATALAWKLPDGVAASRRLFYSYRKNAWGRALEWELSMDQFLDITKRDCYYCGLEPRQEHKTKDSGVYVYNGIDRVDSTGPYSIDNCVAACKRCNYAKRAMSLSEFLAFIERVFSHSILKQKRAAA